MVERQPRKGHLTREFKLTKRFEPNRSEGYVTMDRAAIREEARDTKVARANGTEGDLHAKLRDALSTLLTQARACAPHTSRKHSIKGQSQRKTGQYSH